MFKLNFRIIPVQIFLGIFWFKNGFIDKVCGILSGIIDPVNAYQGDTWAGWAGYIVGTWDKSAVGHVVLSPLFNVMFPVLILLQCLPFVMVLIGVFNKEFMEVSRQDWTERAGLASMFVTSVMLFSQTLAGASDGQYLWQLLGLNMVLMMYLKSIKK